MLPPLQFQFTDEEKNRKRKEKKISTLASSVVVASFLCSSASATSALPDAALLPVHAVLSLQSPQLFFLRLQRRPPRVLGRVEVENNQVSAADVEAREVVGGVFGVEDVLEDDEGGALCGLAVPQADLADRAVLAEDVVDLLRGDREGEVADKEDPEKFFFFFFFARGLRRSKERSKGGKQGEE